MKNSLFLRYSNKITISFLLLFACFLVAGCSDESKKIKSEEASHSEDINKKTVEAVLELELTAPDKEYVSLMEKAGVLSNNLSETEANSVKADYEEIDSYVKSIYESYFTENGLERFLSKTPAYQFQHLPKEYQLSIADIEVNQSENENTKNYYDFIVHVTFESPKEEKTLYEISGKAVFSDDGKIKDIQIGDKDQLLNKKINEVNNL